MQQPGHPMGPMPAISPASITTEQIQKYLDENKQLILAILDNQNLGKLAECAQYQAQLQKNLLYLAAIADAQPPTTSVRPQMIPHAGMQQGVGGHYMPQAPIFPPRPSLQFTPQQVQEHQQQQQQLHHQPQLLPFQGHMGMRPVSVMNGMHAPVHAEPSRGMGGSSAEVPPGGPNLAEFPRGSTPSSSVDARGSKQDASGAAPEPPAAATADGQRSSAKEKGSGDVKRTEDAKTTP